MLFRMSCAFLVHARPVYLLQGDSETRSGPHVPAGPNGCSDRIGPGDELNFAKLSLAPCADGL